MPEETNILKRIGVFLLWVALSFAWFIGIFSKKVYAMNEQWLINYGRDTKPRNTKSLNTSSSK